MLPGSANIALSLARHAEDVAAIVETLREPPVIVAHSLGGLVLYRYLAEAQRGRPGFARLPGVAFLDCTPPKASCLLRHLLTAPLVSLKVRV